MAKNDKILIDGIIDERVELSVPSNKRDEVFEFFVFAFTLQAQIISKPVICGNEIFNDILQRQYPDLLANINATFEEAKQMPRDLRNDPIDVDVVVHVVWKEEAENLHDSIIENQIEILNNDFNRLNSDTSNLRPLFDSVAGNPRIRFHLAEIVRVQTDVEFAIDLLSGSTNLLPEVKHTVDGGSDGWDHTDFINIWICKIQPLEIFGIEIGQILCFSFPPNNLPHWPQNVGAPNPDEDGLVIDYRVFGSNNPNEIIVPGTSDNLIVKGRTPVHEMGHFLGLRHIWGDSETLEPENDCEQSDGIEDTPYASSQSNFICDISRNTCEKIEEHYSQDMPDLIENFMDYASEDCMNMFTKGQATLMRNILFGPRVALITETSVEGGIENETPFMISPNPAHNHVTITFADENIIDMIRVVDLHGKIVIEQKVVPAKTHHLDLVQMAPGLFIVQALAKTSLQSSKLIIE